jgi:hypothetical protein
MFSRLLYYFYPHLISSDSPLKGGIKVLSRSNILPDDIGMTHDDLVTVCRLLRLSTVEILPATYKNPTGLQAEQIPV